jgi:hypothetical protein
MFPLTALTSDYPAVMDGQIRDHTRIPRCPILPG